MSSAARREKSRNRIARTKTEGSAIEGSQAEISTQRVLANNLLGAVYKTAHGCNDDTDKQFSQRIKQ